MLDVIKSDYGTQKENVYYSKMIMNIVISYDNNIFS